jgi:hypothetical protein
VAVWWAPCARVVITWRLGEVALRMEVTWRLGEVVFFTDRDESAKTSWCCGPYCEEFNKSS